jgi:hypothetical protein
LIGVEVNAYSEWNKRCLLLFLILLQGTSGRAIAIEDSKSNTLLKYGLVSSGYTPLLISPPVDSGYTASGDGVKPMRLESKLSISPPIQSPSREGTALDDIGESLVGGTMDNGEEVMRMDCCYSRRRHLSCVRPVFMHLEASGRASP